MRLQYDFSKVSIIVEADIKHVPDLDKLFNNESNPYAFMTASSLLDIEWIGTQLHND